MSSKLTGATTGTGAAGVAANKADDEDKKKLHQNEEEDLLDNYNTEDVDAHDYSNVDHVIFACDAGMGSSAMGASTCNSKAGISDVNVTNTAINHYQIMHNLLSLKTLTDRAIKQVPNAIHISVDNLNSPRYEELLNNLKKDQDKA